MTILLTFIPPIVLLLYFTLSDRFKEPKGTILLVFFLGFLICLPAGILNGLSHDFFYDGSKYSENLTSSFLGPAWAEELLKFSILYLIVLKRNEFNEPMDGLVYGVVVSLGFVELSKSFEFILSKSAPQFMQILLFPNDTFPH